MRRQRLLLIALPISCLLLACGGTSEAKHSAEKSRPSDSEASESLVDGLLDKARGMLPTGDEGAAAPADVPVANESIVRCDVNGNVSYTRQSECDNRGGQSLKMALKKK